MKRDAIRAGAWYDTRAGFGPCLKAGGCFPWAAEVRIVAPMPLGMRMLKPADFKRRLTDAEVARLEGKPSPQLGLVAPAAAVAHAVARAGTNAAAHARHHGGLGDEFKAPEDDAEPEMFDVCVCGHEYGEHQGNTCPPPCDCSGFIKRNAAALGVPAERFALALALLVRALPYVQGEALRAEIRDMLAGGAS